MNKQTKDKRITKILISAKDLELATTKVAQWIDKNYKGKNPLLVSILKGSIPFFAKVISKVTIDMEIDFVAYKSYTGKNKMEHPKMEIDLKQSIKGRHVVVFDDICDSGLTFAFIKKVFTKRHPTSLKFVSMCDKKAARQVPFKSDYNCFDIPNEWVVGFGLDYNECFRNLPYVGILSPSVYQKQTKHKK